MIKMMIVVVVVFAVCCLPLNLLTLSSLDFVLNCPDVTPCQTINEQLKISLYFDFNIIRMINEIQAEFVEKFAQLNEIQKSRIGSNLNTERSNETKQLSWSEENGGVSKFKSSALCLIVGALSSTKVRSTWVNCQCRPLSGGSSDHSKKCHGHLSARSTLDRTCWRHPWHKRGLCKNKRPIKL